jgi:colanic acid biosynthesis glycosyl transferase WcaI
LIGAQTREIATAIVRDADVSLVPLKRGVDDSLPTKLFDALAQGTPVIACAEGEAKRFVESSGGGIVVPPEDERALARAIGELAGDRARCDTLGRNGRAYVRANYDRTSIVSDIVRRVTALSSN